MKKILVIDDDRTSVTLIKARLEAKQYAVDFALDGQMGLEKVKQSRPDLILLDVEMPRMNGYTFITELRKMDGFKSLPVLVLTAHAQHQPIFGLKGIKGYLVKPVDIDVLLDKINKCIGDASATPSSPPSSSTASS